VASAWPVVLAIVMLQPDSPRLGLRSGLNPSAKVPADIATQVLKLADRRGMTVSSIIVLALTEYLANV
jgi:hypothetical protein